MYRVSKNKRKYSPTPIVKITIDKNGNETEDMVCCCVNIPKNEGNKLSELIVELLNNYKHVEENS